MSSTTTACVIIVDGYKFSKDFVESIHAAGLKAIHVFSSEVPIPVLQAGTTYNPTDYEKTLFFNGELTPLIDALAGYQIAAVIPATEPGVLLADELASQFGCPNNGMKKSLARRNKYLMLEAVAETGLPTPRFITTDNLQEIKQWIQKEQPYPMVLKPVAEAATFGVFIIHNEAQLESAFSQLAPRNSLLQQSLSKNLLAEEFLHGEEYAINTLSHQGKHYLIDIWRYHKKHTKEGYCRYDRTVLQASNFEHHEALMSYVFSVLDALDIRFGVGHCEVMCTAEGPRLIEIGARLSGISDKALWNRCLGYNQVDLCVASYLGQTSDFSFLEHNIPKEDAMVITLENDLSGKILQMPDPEVIKQCQSYYKHAFNYGVGQQIGPTTSPTDAPGRITLVNGNRDILLKDYEFLIRYCKEQLIIE
jgi:hypothetical protein